MKSIKIIMIMLMLLLVSPSFVYAEEEYPLVLQSNTGEWSDWNCGPSVIEMVLMDKGKGEGVENIRREKKGGYTLEDIEGELLVRGDIEESGTYIVVLNNSIWGRTGYHCVLVTKVDESPWGKKVFFNDPYRGRMSMFLDMFEKGIEGYYGVLEVK